MRTSLIREPPPHAVRRASASTIANRLHYCPSGNPGFASNQSDGRAVIYRKLPLQSFGDVLLIAEIHHQRSNAQPDPCDLRRIKVMLVMKLDAAIDCRMIHDAVWERLIGIRAQIE